MDKQIIFDISALARANIGTSEHHSFEIPETKTSGQVEIMRTEEALSVKGKDIKTTVDFKCEKCLEDFSQAIEIPVFEREFLFEKPGEIEDPNDIFLVDKKKLEIDLSEALRQEIILHFPLIPVCSSGCRGLCPHCGINRNEKPCNCKDEEAEPNKPLAALKDLIK